MSTMGFFFSLRRAIQVPACSCSQLYTGPPMNTFFLGGSGQACDGGARVAIIGHRGCGKNVIVAPGLNSSLIPSPSPAAQTRPSIMENTIASFDLAARDGADFVEFDVQITKDGHPVIFHDHTIIVDNKDGRSFQQARIGDLTVNEFLSIGCREEEVTKGERVLLRKAPGGAFCVWEVCRYAPLCTLRQAFEQVSSKVGFNIELKFDDFRFVSRSELRRAIDATLKVVTEAGSERRLFFSSFHPDAVHILRREQSSYPVLFLTDGGCDTFHSDSRRNSLEAALLVCQTGGLQGVVAEVRAILQHPEAVRDIKNVGLSLLTYGDMNNIVESLHLQEKLGVDGLIVDHVPEMVSESWRRARSSE